MKSKNTSGVDLEKLKRLYHLHSQTLPYKKVLKKTQENIERRLKNHKKIAVGFSGGKDSTVLLDLIGTQNRDVTVLFIDSGANFPDTEELLNFYKTKYKIVREKSDKTYQEIMSEEEQKKKPFSNSYWMDQVVFNPLKRFLKNNQIDLNCVGLRSQESKTRQKRFSYYSDYRESVKQEVITFYPLSEWGYMDIWAYIYTNELKYNSLYDKQRELKIPDSVSRVDSYLEIDGVNNQSFNILKNFYPEIIKKEPALHGI